MYQRAELRFARAHLYRIFGVDLTAIPGISVLTAHTLLAEVGPDLSRFRSGAAFASCLGLCPDNDISGGKKLSVKTRLVSNRAAWALRMGVNGLYKSQTWLGNFFRRMRAKLGAPKAITATAHKLARIVYQILRAFLERTDEVRFEGSNRGEVHAWISGTPLCAQEYWKQAKQVKGLLRRYMQKMTGLSRAQVARLITAYLETGRVEVRCYRRNRFAQRYTAADITLLAEVDEAHENLSGPATRKILRASGNTTAIAV